MIGKGHLALTFRERYEELPDNPVKCQGWIFFTIFTGFYKKTDRVSCQNRHFHVGEWEQYQEGLGLRKRGSNVPGDILHGLGNPSFCLAGIIINRCVMLTEKKRGAQKEIQSLLPVVQLHAIRAKIEYATVCDILI